MSQWTRFSQQFAALTNVNSSETATERALEVACRVTLDQFVRAGRNILHRLPDPGPGNPLLTLYRD